VQVGSAYWLRVPLGKLHNDRYIPLHPQLKALLDAWLVEALYDHPKELPNTAEGRAMAKLRREMTRRMLGNGHCARPIELDCHFETICESCSFFVTTTEFQPTLERQLEDAVAKDQVGRQKIFERLLARRREQAS
jgi:hypothetical protein